MRVAICIWRMSVGGAERQLIHVASGLIRRGIDVHAVTAFPGALDESLAATGTVMHRVHAATRYDPFVAMRVLRCLRSIRPDVVQTYLTQMDILAGPAARLLGIPWVLGERSVAAAYPRNLVNGARAVAGRFATAVIANSAEGADYWSARRKGKAVQVIPNVVPLEAIGAATPVMLDAIEPGDRVILYVGRFSEEKNLENLIRGLSTALRGDGVKAVFCGDGPIRLQIEPMVDQLGIRSKTIFTGVVNDVWRCMKRADVLVAVSTFEGNPNGVLEAIAAGLPLVVSDIPAHRAILASEDALFVDPSSPESIASALLNCLEDRQSALKRATHARNGIEGRSEMDIAALYEAAYRDLAGVKA